MWSRGDGADALRTSVCVCVSVLMLEKVYSQLSPKVYIKLCTVAFFIVLCVS